MLVPGDRGAGSASRFIAAKGSIAVQGVSLTVNGVEGRRFHLNPIPHAGGHHARDAFGG
ncbi:MAG: hypothetical protein IPN24_00020 [Betaproteobacteria bacterium]|nr:hypothetical protein [Betaproteobacteria bacterium]